MPLPFSNDQELDDLFPTPDDTATTKDTDMRNYAKTVWRNLRTMIERIAGDNRERAFFLLQLVLKTVNDFSQIGKLFPNERCTTEGQIKCRDALRTIIQHQMARLVAPVVGVVADARPVSEWKAETQYAAQGAARMPILHPIARNLRESSGLTGVGLGLFVCCGAMALIIAASVITFGHHSPPPRPSNSTLPTPPPADGFPMPVAYAGAALLGVFLFLVCLRRRFVTAPLNQTEQLTRDAQTIMTDMIEPIRPPLTVQQIEDDLAAQVRAVSAGFNCHCPDCIVQEGAEGKRDAREGAERGEAVLLREMNGEYTAFNTGCMERMLQEQQDLEPGNDYISRFGTAIGVNDRGNWQLMFNNTIRFDVAAATINARQDSAPRVAEGQRAGLVPEDEKAREHLARAREVASRQLGSALPVSAESDVREQKGVQCGAGLGPVRSISRALQSDAAVDSGEVALDVASPRSQSASAADGVRSVRSLGS